MATQTVQPLSNYADDPYTASSGTAQQPPKQQTTQQVTGLPGPSYQATGYQNPNQTVASAGAKPQDVGPGGYDPLAFQAPTGPANVNPIPTAQYSAPSVQAASAGTVQPPQYTGPQFQAQNPYGIADNSQNISDFNVWDDISGTYRNASGQEYDPRSDFDRAYSAANPSPLSQMTEAEKTAYWAGQAGPAGGVMLPGGVGANDPNYADKYAQYLNTNAGQIGDLTQRVQDYQKTALADQNALTNQFNSDNARADWASYANALNNQQGYAGSGMDYLDPNNPPAWWGTLTESGTQSGAPVNTVANPLDAQHQMPDLGTITSSGWQDAPTDQGGTVHYENGPGAPPGTYFPPSGGGTPGTGGGTGGGPAPSTPPIPWTDYVGGGGGDGGGAPIDNLGGLPNGPNTPAGGGLQPNVQTTDPTHDLRSMQITPGALLDRFKLAQQQFGTFADSTSPQYQAALRDATRAAAGAGRLGSGMLRTSYGDLANQRAQSLQNERDTLFQGALLGSVQDAQTQFEDLMKEQAYQSGAQNQAFNQSVSAADLQERLEQGGFNRALQQFMQGEGNNPADMLMQLSQSVGNQATGASQAMAQLIQGLMAGSQNSDFMNALRAMAGQGGNGGGGGGTPAPQVPTNTVNPPLTIPPVRDPIPSNEGQDYMRGY